MGRLREDIIESKENRAIAMLAREYVGDDNYKNVAKIIDVDPSTLSNLCRGKVKPSTEVLVKMGSHPRNGVTYERFVETLGCSVVTYTSESPEYIALKEENTRLKAEIYDLMKTIEKLKESANV